MSSNRSDAPNVIWIFGDQMRAQAMGYMGDPNVHTPNLDRLAQEGLALTAAVGGCPLCSPYRGSLLTGRYPQNAVAGHQYPLDPTMPTIAAPFRDEGYHTAYFGKWHLDGFQERVGPGGRAGLHVVPPNRRGGFDHWIGYENNNSQWDCWVHGHEGAGEKNEVAQYRLPGFETDALTDLFIDYLKQRGTAGADNTVENSADQPFFAVLSAQPPHDPYAAPEAWMARHNCANLQLRPNVPNIPRVQEHARRELAGYYAMIENLDWNVGRIRQTLVEYGLAHNTHIIFFSDHGDMHGSHGQFRKTNPYEESIRVPFIIGGHQPRYQNRDGYIPIPINHVDIGATSLGLCGIDVPDWIEGTDYSPYRTGHRGEEPVIPNEPESAYLQLVVPTLHPHSTDRPWRGVATRDGWKYTVLEGQPWMLYNLNEDPYEQANHAHNRAYAKERQQLQEQLAAWITQTGDTFSLPDIG